MIEKWSVFGPIPGRKRFMPDAGGKHFASEIPRSLTVNGQVFHPVVTAHEKGLIDLEALLGLRGFPAAVMFSRIEAETDRSPLFSFACDNRSEVWLNGRRIYSGGGSLPFSNQMMLHLQAGVNILMVKLTSGLNGWYIRFTRLEDFADKRDSPPAAPLPCSPVVRESLPRDYLLSGVRIEQRGDDILKRDRRAEPHFLREAGAEAQWIQICDDRVEDESTGTPLFENDYLPASPRSVKDGQDRIKQLVRAVHKAGMPVIAWHTLSSCGEAPKLHPDWASKPLSDAEAELDGWELSRVCVNSPYGERLIKFCSGAAAELDLDGFWFDGAYFAGRDWAGCACLYCRKKFKEEEGLELPDRIDWGSEAFVRWVKWRYRVYSEFWKKLASEIKKRSPRAVVGINHLHRNAESWVTGCPLNPFEAPIFGATEASSENFTSSFTTRLIKAYGYSNVDVWMSSGKPPVKGDIPCPQIHHALSCLTAGGMPSFGGVGGGRRARKFVNAYSSFINPRKEWIRGEAVPYAALHVSEQAETFHFSRGKRGAPVGYWNSVLGWHNLLIEGQLLVDIIFDAHLRPDILGKYRAVIMPLSTSLSAEQLAGLQEYIKKGGELFAGPGFGTRDEGGEPAAKGRQIPASDNLTLFSGDEGGEFLSAPDFAKTLHLTGVIKAKAPPVLDVSPDPDLHAGLFKTGGGYTLHIQNTYGYSTCAKEFPNPIYGPPRVKRGIRIKLKGMDVKSAETVAGEGCPRVEFLADDEGIDLHIPELSWGAVIKLSYDGPAKSVRGWSDFETGG